MNKKPLIKGIRNFLAELVQEGSHYIALFIGVLLWIATQSVWVGVISGIVCAAILYILVDKITLTEEAIEEEANNTKTKQPIWYLVLTVLMTIALGSLVAYFVVN